MHDVPGCHSVSAAFNAFCTCACGRLEMKSIIESPRLLPISTYMRERDDERGGRPFCTVESRPRPVPNLGEIVISGDTNEITTTHNFYQFLPKVPFTPRSVHSSCTCSHHIFHFLPQVHSPSYSKSDSSSDSFASPSYSKSESSAFASPSYSKSSPPKERLRSRSRGVIWTRTLYFTTSQISTNSYRDKRGGVAILHPNKLLGMHVGCYDTAFQILSIFRSHGLLERVILKNNLETTLKTTQSLPVTART